MEVDRRKRVRARLQWGELVERHGLGALPPDDLERELQALAERLGVVPNDKAPDTD